MAEPRQPRSTFLNAVVALGFHAAIACPSLLFFQQKHYTGELQSVSGFYGPGNVIAWLITAFWTILSCDCPVTSSILTRGVINTLPARIKRKFAQDSSQPANDDDNDNTAGIDPAFLSVVTYPMVASIDAFIRGIHQEGSYKEDAAASIARLSSMICTFVLWDFFLIVRRTSQGQVIPGRLSLGRISLWFLLTIANLVAIAAQGHKMNPNLFTWRFLWPNVQSLVFILIILNLSKNDGANNGTYVSFFFLFVFWVWQAERERPEELSVPTETRVAWPRSSSSLRDIGQWPALFVACLGISWSIFEGAKKLFTNARRRNSEQVGENLELTNM